MRELGYSRMRCSTDAVVVARCTRELRAQLANERGSKNSAYEERNWLVAALSKFLPSFLARHPDADEEWEDDWRWIVFIIGAAGQMSWHIHDSELTQFDHLHRSRDQNQWDGHSTEEKYRRLGAITLPTFMDLADE